MEVIVRSLRHAVVDIKNRNQHHMDLLAKYMLKDQKHNRELEEVIKDLENLKEYWNRVSISTEDDDENDCASIMGFVDDIEQLINKYKEF